MNVGGARLRSLRYSMHYQRASLVSSVRRLTGIAVALKAPARQSEWSEYDQQHSYSDADQADKDDSIAQDMLSLRPNMYDDYNWPEFEFIVRRHADILPVADTHAGRRRLCHVRARGTYGDTAAREA